MTVLCSHGFQVYGRGDESIHVGTGDICRSADANVDVAQHIIDTLRESTQQVPVHKVPPHQEFVTQERMDDATVVAENMAAAMREGYDPAAGVPGAYIPAEVLTRGLPSMSFSYETPKPITEWCGTNDVHPPHICHGVQRDGTGLNRDLSTGMAVPLPVEPQTFNPEVQGILGYPQEGSPDFFDRDDATVQPWATYPTTFSINDEQGRELLSFRVVNGMVEGKFYFSDLDEAARRFVDYVHSLPPGSPVPLTD